MFLVFIKISNREKTSQKIDGFLLKTGLTWTDQVLTPSVLNSDRLIIEKVLLGNGNYRLEIESLPLVGDHSGLNLFIFDVYSNGKSKEI